MSVHSHPVQGLRPTTNSPRQSHPGLAPLAQAHSHVKAGLWVLQATLYEPGDAHCRHLLHLCTEVDREGKSKRGVITRGSLMPVILSSGRSNTRKAARLAV